MSCLFFTKTNESYFSFHFIGLIDTYRLVVEAGKTYLVRIIYAAVNNKLFFEIVNHSYTVVSVDACYTNPLPN